MHLKTFLLCFVIFPCVVFSQTRVLNELHVFDGEAEYAYRPFSRTGEGEILQKVPSSLVGGIGRINGIRVVIQDQDAATSEKIWIILRKADSRGRPDISSSGIILKRGPYTISGNGAGTRAWNFYFHFSQPLSVADKDFFYGVLLSKGRSNTDFASLHMSGDYPASTCGEHPRKGISPGLAWRVNYSNGAPVSTSKLPYNLAWDMGILSERPQIQGYAIDPASKCLTKKNVPDFGYAGLWPDLVDLEGYGYKAMFGWRVRDRRNANKTNVKGFIFLSSRMLGTPYYLPGTGNWFLDPHAPIFDLFFVVSFDYFGEGKAGPVDPPQTLRSLLLGTRLYAQALVYDSTGNKYFLTGYAGIDF